MSLTITDHAATVSSRIPEKSIAQRLGVRVSTVRTLGLEFASLAGVDAWLAEASVEDLLKLRQIETTSRAAA